MIYFSDALLDLARPHLGQAAAQYTLFGSVVDTATVIRPEYETGLVRIGDLELRAGMLGTLAEDATFQWAWAKAGLVGTPAVAASHRLRDLGERHKVPELAEGMIDLGHLPDPRAGADILGIMAVGLLGARGMFAFGHGGRALTLMVVEDETVPVAPPDPSRAADSLWAAVRMLPGTEPHDAVVAGYAAHHGLSADSVPGGLEVGFPQGDRLVAEVGPDGALANMTVTGPDGGPPTALERPAPLARATPPPPPIAPELLARLVPYLADVLHQSFALRVHLAGLGWDGTTLSWDPAAGVLGFGGVFDAAAREIAVFSDGVWEWAEPEWEGVARLREIARECGAADLAAGRADLGLEPPGGNVAVVLARAAVHLGGGCGLMRVQDGDAHRYVAITDPRLPGPSYELTEVCDAVLSTADILQPVVPGTERYPVMRSMVLGYFERCGLAPLYVGEPEMLIGRRGLHEARVMFGGDGTILKTSAGLQGTFG